jgi:hypothetical protein
MDAGITGPRRSIMARRAALAAIVALLAFVPLTPGTAVPASYAGFGDTGWNFEDKRICCQSAVSLAQSESIRLCERAGGDARLFPAGNTKGTRGLCDWDGKGNGFNRVYRCIARTDVHCH